VTATLSDVAAGLRRAERHGPDVELVDASHDSRQIDAGWLFCAIRGNTVDGHDHAAQAVEAGAAALLVERWLDLPVPQVRVPSVRAAAGPAAATVHGRPSDELTVVGITGTNGKTTTAYLLEGAFAAAAMGTGVIGTIETRIHGDRQPGVRTTPEGPDLQRLLRRMRTRGVDAVAMEVSSHGLDLRRVDGTHFAVAAYTNLSQDHLDWHGSMAAYLAAKARLFTPAFADRGVVHLDGPWAKELLAQAEIPVLTFGREADADVRIVDEVLAVEGSQARLVGDGLDLVVRTVLPGRFNLTNAATALVAAVAAGVDPDAAAAGIAACPGAPGRLERVDEGQPFTVVVDYAHTPDAVTQVLDTLRASLGPGRLHVVLGCGGGP
jgi:UDP-N-acetylmuramoyl-L-alanyl-D-glutamate--2,6-diaminopimelate ligase